MQGIGSLFFGLWLIPMGYIDQFYMYAPLAGQDTHHWRSGYLPITFSSVLGMDGMVTELLVIPATIGEFWMIGYLLIFGIRQTSNA